MPSLDLARWQFAVVTIFHFFFVPVTIGLSVLVATMQTLAYRRKDPVWEQLTQLFGRLFLINLAVGVVTGIVLEFQFGMNWSAYSIFVGNIFGAPLAIEGLLAFFLESTFVGLWIFGKGRLPPAVHAATIWLTSLGTVLSAFFILAANSWMQHPVGYKVVHHKAFLTDFWAVLGNSTLWAAFAHTVLAALVTAGMLVLAVSAWQIRRRRHVHAFIRSARLSTVVSLVGIVLTSVAGDLQARLMDSQQPMKMAAAEALYNTKRGASFSLLTIGNLSGRPIFQIRVPHLLSLIATLSWNGQVQGVNQIQALESARYGHGSYVPVLWITYWSFRVMVGMGILLILLTAWGTWLAHRRRIDRSPWFLRAALVGVALPFAANATGWLFTEMGRQPWVVYGLLRTVDGVSPTVGMADVIGTLTTFVAVYVTLGVVDAVLMVKAARRPLGEPEPEGPPAVEGLVY